MERKPESLQMWCTQQECKRCSLNVAASWASQHFWRPPWGGNTGLGHSLSCDEQRELGHPTPRLKEVAIFPPTIHPLAFAGISVSVAAWWIEAGNWEVIWPSRRAVFSHSNSLSGHSKVRCQGGSKPGWGRVCFSPRQCTCLPALSVCGPAAVWFVFGRGHNLGSWRTIGLTRVVLRA